jgi:peptidoglycan-associated lipoprotein
MHKTLSTKNRTSMKAIKVSYIVAALVLCIGAMGCKKRPEGITYLPGTKAGITDRPGGPIDSGLTGSDIPTTGIPATGSRTDWIPDANTFRDQTVYFDFDKAIVKSSELPKLETVASQFRSQHQGKALRIEGHCDERGTEEYNRSLGERRAQSVREALVRLGIDANLIETISLGEERPLNPGHDDSAWSKNRRGEIVLLSPPTGNVGTSGNQ